jgi:hypothetical protein
VLVRIRWVAALAAGLAWLPSSASAATVRSDGRITFTAAPGEHNRLTIGTDRRGTVFTDAGAVVVARGDCTRVTLHRARCPLIDRTAFARLGDRGDAVHVGAPGLVVTGGSGDDVLRGSRYSDSLSGQAGSDVVVGGRRDDLLTGGPGRDRLVGGPGSDTLLDGETGAQAARDVLSGGRDPNSGPSDRVVYARRRAGLRIDLRRGSSSTEDVLRSIESITGGHGADRLYGDGDRNWLAGGPGNDLLHGRDGADIPSGGRGDDRAYGDRGDDTVWGDVGRDRLFGGAGDDFVISRENQAPVADSLDCGLGADAVRSNRIDTLVAGCESLSTFSNALFVGVQPAIDLDSADFGLRCSGGFGPELSCAGTITITGLDGVPFGTARFAVPNDLALHQVVVPLTPEGSAALQAGTTVQVHVLSDSPRNEQSGGYRVFMRAGLAIFG